MRLRRAWIWANANIPHQVAWPAVLIGAWGFCLHGREKTDTAATWISVGTSAFLIMLVAIRAATERKMTPAALLVDLIVTFAAFVGSFAYLYYDEGTGRAFSQDLSRLDAVYFAVGTVSTAGTGNINALSEGARATQLAEMLLAMVLVIVAGGFVLVRYMAPMMEKSRKRQRRR
jgi:hypothetical protein